MVFFLCRNFVVWVQVLSVYFLRSNSKNNHQNQCQGAYCTLSFLTGILWLQVFKSLLQFELSLSVSLMCCKVGIHFHTACDYSFTIMFGGGQEGWLLLFGKTTIYLWVCLGSLYSLPIIYVFVSRLVVYCFDYFNFILLFEIRRVMHLALFFLKMAFIIQGLF